ncbi:MAG: terminase family protein [Aigarchaeota archaeon]|nr:terminase family protein [Aigarchaeota archaeon]MDW8093059.1 terminase family protein [Nitrososphaerota archaeon]
MDVERLLDPPTFAGEVLSLPTFPYQSELLRDRSKRIIVCAGRQVGKSTAAAIKAIHFTVTNHHATTLIVSASARQSGLLFEKVRELITRSRVLKRSIRSQSATKIAFSNSSWIIALPCGRYGSTIRGYSADLCIIDEASFVPSEVIEMVVLPMLAATDGTCWMLSTPWGMDHTFYRAWTSDVWKRYHWPSNLSPLITESFLSEQRSLIGDERFRAEYMAEFVGDQDSFFPIGLLRRCVRDYHSSLEPGLRWGYDPGGRSSSAAIVALRRECEKCYVVFKKTLRNVPYVSVNALLAEFHREFPFERLVIDETGLGGPLCEHLKDLGVPVEGVKLTQERVSEIFSKLKIAMEEGRLFLPQDLELLNHLNAVIARPDSRGGFRFDKRPGTFDDLAYALALAYHNLNSGGKLYTISF